MVAKVLGKTGAHIKAHEMMHNAVVQVVLLYGRKIWVKTEPIMTMLEVFHHMVARQNAGMTERKGNGWEWG